MNKVVISFLMLLLPLIGHADEGSMTFAPPAGDYSVVFLGNLFGIVDGVLHGSGSQIMGQMFAVFNAAVLALGGMIITYTLMVSTMNTAHEGEMMGKKWSSIWVPVRATGGLALLMPKASGYCLLQIFVMWIVVQGVGAADKVWDAALNYLNRGGVIIHEQRDPASKLLANHQGLAPLAHGASVILTGQVCMQSLQNILQRNLNAFKEQYSKNKTGPCSDTFWISQTGKPLADYQSFIKDDMCNLGSIPSLIDSVNITEAYKNGAVSISMPNFSGSSGPALVSLNGYCGKITWINDKNALNKPGSPEDQSVVGNNSNDADNLNDAVSNGLISQGDKDMLLNSRGMAIQQMYLDLATVARVMVGNDPELQVEPSSSDSSDSNSSASTNYDTKWAKQPFGYPMSNYNGSKPCSKNDSCTRWSDPDGSALFTGGEIANAVADYEGTMRPLENLLSQLKNQTTNNSEKDFIVQAESSGWIMAGSYFFDVVKLNGDAVGGSKDINIPSGMEKSESTAGKYINTVFDGDDKTCKGYSNGANSYGLICGMLNQDETPLIDMVSLIGSTTGDPNYDPSSYLKKMNPVAVPSPNASTVFGYIDNTEIIKLPGQPGTTPLQFANVMNIDFSKSTLTLPSVTFACGGITIFSTFCIGRFLGEMLYNQILVPLMNFAASTIIQLAEQVVMTVIMIPLQGIAAIFKEGLDILQVQGINPIVALANMGTFYINFAGQLMIMLTVLTMSISATIAGLPVLTLLPMAMPIVFSWLAVMVSVGMITAYYIPILPFMIFTFGAIAWLMAVIEAMVAAPIVALGVTHPEGHEVFGKAEPAIMILVNVFLRPTMMVIGFVAGIALSYVGIWVLNAGFQRAIGFMQPTSTQNTASNWNQLTKNTSSESGSQYSSNLENQYDSSGTNLVKSESGDSTVSLPGGGSVEGGYTSWAGIFAYFMSILIYTTMYMTIVEKAFGLIVSLPDKVLRWIGGSPESYGQETSQWTEQSKGKVQEGGKALSEGQAQMGKQMEASVSKKTPSDKPPEQGNVDVN